MLLKQVKKMKLKTKNKLSTDFETSSLTDIVFLLLIFFMVTATYKTYESINVDLPKSNNSKLISEFINIIITKDLRYYLDGEEVQFKNMVHKLRNKLSATSAKNVLIESDKTVPISYIISLADIAVSLDSNISIATKEELNNIE